MSPMITTDSSNSVDLNIKVSACLSEHPEFIDHVKYLRELIDLASAVAAGAEQIQLDSRNSRCQCLFERLGPITQCYAEAVKALNAERISLNSMTDDVSWERVANLVGVKVRLNRELRMHFNAISNVILLRGKEVNVVADLSSDVELLNDLATDVKDLMDEFITLAGRLCESCARERDRVSAANGLASWKLRESLFSHKEQTNYPVMPAKHEDTPPSIQGAPPELSKLAALQRFGPRKMETANPITPIEGSHSPPRTQGALLPSRIQPPRPRSSTDAQISARKPSRIPPPKASGLGRTSITLAGFRRLTDGNQKPANCVTEW